ncbi:hypothetical protein AYI70_g4463 [Smittium culicis]|uniref:Uncharacterized protein n=1 Tax=Smittium culicis TaxID=133412 RepID=A0A1R1XZ11_9FUNG|nr:hypothetical protein AYI70_g4463 [Smittium culicis]
MVSFTMFQGTFVYVTFKGPFCETNYRSEQEQHIQKLHTSQPPLHPSNRLSRALVSSHCQPNLQYKVRWGYRHSWHYMEESQDFCVTL